MTKEREEHYEKKERYQQLYHVSPPQGRSNFLRLDMNENLGGLPADFVQATPHNCKISGTANREKAAAGRLLRKLASWQTPYSV